MKSSCSRTPFPHSISFTSFVFLLALLSSFWVTAGYAETFMVTTLSDDVPGSLRTAIASADSYDDEISFAVTGTITLNSTLEINGDKSMKIQGPGADLLTISGGGKFRVFSIKTTASVDISGISIESGYAYHGGGILNESDGLTLIKCDFSSNNATLYGGGMRNLNSSPVVTNCTFSSNSAGKGGGGLFNFSSSSPIVTNCTFSSNTAGQGGGMYNYINSSPTVTNCTFEGNTVSDDYGGGMYNNVSSPDIINCTFSENTADYGGGMYNSTSSPDIANCTFNGNVAELFGGGIGNYNSSPEVANCTFFGNDAENGGGMDNEQYSSPIVTNCTFRGNSTGASKGGDGMCNFDNSNPTVTNCIFWDESGYEIDNLYLVDGTSIPTLSFCVVQNNDVGGGSNLDNIITADPMLEPLADNGGPTWTCALGEGSSAIDEGTDSGSIPNADQRGIERPQGAGYDIGAYEVEQSVIDGGGGGCSISVLPVMGLLLMIPVIFLSRKMK